jgi:phage/plasmid-associated DNA primase
LSEFIAENFTADAESYCTKADVFASYLQWANQQGINYKMSKRALGVELINRRWNEGKATHENQKCWLGYRLQN